MTAARQMALQEPPRPVFVEVVRLERRLARLSLSTDDRDAALIAASLSYVGALVSELDRVRPLSRRDVARLPWDGE